MGGAGLDWFVGAERWWNGNAYVLLVESPSEDLLLAVSHLPFNGGVRRQELRRFCSEALRLALEGGLGSQQTILLWLAAVFLG